MQFTRHGDVIRVVRITGPTPNILGLQFGAGSSAPELEELQAPGPRMLSAEDVLREVCAGIDEESLALQWPVSIRRIQFAASDSAPATVYRDLARAILRYYASAEVSPLVTQPITLRRSRKRPGLAAHQVHRSS